MYGIVIGSEPKTKEEFLAELAAESGPFGSKSVDTNMFVMGAGAAALKAGLNPQDEDIREAITEKIRRQS
jgi:hypothetical protein